MYAQCMPHLLSSSALIAIPLSWAKLGSSSCKHNKENKSGFHHGYFFQGLPCEPSEARLDGRAANTVVVYSPSGAHGLNSGWMQYRDFQLSWFIENSGNPCFQFFNGKSLYCCFHIDNQKNGACTRCLKKNDYHQIDLAQI